MAENQVSIERQVRLLPSPFFVVALKIRLNSMHLSVAGSAIGSLCNEVQPGYVSNAQEVAILNSQGRQHPLDTLKACITLDEMRFLQARLNKCVSART